MEEKNEAAAEQYTPVAVSIKSLIEAGAHFGHQSERWNPKMLPNIYGQRNRIHIINLDQTLARWEKARRAIVDAMALGGSILFVGTKLQAREPVMQHARRCGAHYVTARWLGGTLSNFQTIKNSIERMRKLEDLLKQSNDEASEVKLKKKEKLAIARELGKLEASLGGIRSMRRPPEIVFVVDIVKEEIAVAESRKLHIPVVGLVDTNADPNRVTHPIPCNDDATRTIGLMAAAVADAVLEGRAIFEARKKKDTKPVEVSGAVNGESHGSNGRSEEAAAGLSAS